MVNASFFQVKMDQKQILASIFFDLVFKCGIYERFFQRHDIFCRKGVCLHKFRYRSVIIFMYDHIILSRNKSFSVSVSLSLRLYLSTYGSHIRRNVWCRMRNGFRLTRFWTLALTSGALYIFVYTYTRL